MFLNCILLYIRAYLLGKINILKYSELLVYAKIENTPVLSFLKFQFKRSTILRIKEALIIKIKKKPAINAKRESDELISLTFG